MLKDPSNEMAFLVSAIPHIGKASGVGYWDGGAVCAGCLAICSPVVRNATRD